MSSATRKKACSCMTSPHIPKIGLPVNLRLSAFRAAGRAHAVRDVLQDSVKTLYSGGAEQPYPFNAPAKNVCLKELLLAGLEAHRQQTSVHRQSSRRISTHSHCHLTERKYCPEASGAGCRCIVVKRGIKP